MKNPYLSLNAQLTGECTRLPLAAVGRAHLEANRSTSENRTQPEFRLTARERDVLALLCAGLPNKLISRELGISGSTVKSHVASIFREFGVTSRLQAVVWARRYQLPGDNDARAPAAAAPQAQGGTSIPGSRSPRSSFSSWTP